MGRQFVRVATPSETIIFGVCTLKHGERKTAWIELHQSLRTNPKVTRLATKLGIDRNAATGLLVNLWLWAIDHAENGQLRRYTDEELAEAVFWRGNPNELRCAMRDAGWEDSDETIHDWEEYGIRLLIQARRRKYRWLKKKKGMKGTFQLRSENIAGTTTVPNQPNQPKDIKDGTDKSLRAFMRHFTQTLKTKSGLEADARLVKKAYGKAVGYLKTYPEEQAALSEELDRTPAKMPQAWYVAFLCGQLEQRTHEKIKAMAEPVGKLP